MRIRKRLPPLFFTSSAPPPSDPVPAAQPPNQPSQQIIAIDRKENTWVFPKIDTSEEKIKKKEYAKDEAWKEEENKSNFCNDIKRIISISDQELDINKILLPSSSSSKGSWDTEDHKKNESFERNSKMEKMISVEMKSKTSNIVPVDNLKEENGVKKKSKRGNVIMEGSRCSKGNGRGWRCCQPTLVGYSLCEHHLGKGRLRSTGGVLCSYMIGGVGVLLPPNGGEYGKVRPLIVTKKRRTTKVVKARTMSSLLKQI